MQNKRSGYRRIRLFGVGLSLALVFLLLWPSSVQAARKEPPAGALPGKAEEDAFPREGDKAFYETRPFLAREGQPTDKTDTKPAKREWVVRNQRTYYQIEGKKQTGLQSIDGKAYFFDSRGIQRTGWQSIDGNFYFFRIANGKKGYMETSKEINGITLKKNGRARLTESSRVKLDVLWKANQIVEKVTKPGMSQSEKLKRCYQYAKQQFEYRGSPQFKQSAHWEFSYALDMFDKGHGSCYSYGAAMAFLANAVGYEECYAISSGGHGWAEIDGRVYDISWDLVDKSHSYYALSYSLSGVDGRPNYQKARKYIKKI